MTQVWSATQLNAHLSGGGTTTLTTSTASTAQPAYGSESFATGSGKFVWVIKVTSSAFGTSQSVGGLGNTSSSIADGQPLGGGFDTVGVYGSTNSGIWTNGFALTIAFPFTIASGDLMGHAWDNVNNLLWIMDITQSSLWYGAATSGNPATGTNGFSLTQTSMTLTAHPIVPAFNLFASGDVGVGYFAPSSWPVGFTPPSGFTPFDHCTNTLAAMGVGCSIGWRASLLAAGAWRAAKAIEKNDIISRRRLLLPSRGC